MDIKELDKNALRLILKTSEGFPSQVSQAKIIKGRLSPTPVGHAVSSHLHSASSVSYKTKFISMDDMLEAFWLVLHTSQGQKALKDLRPGARQTLQVDVNGIFGVECETQGLGKHKFTKQDQSRAGCNHTKCLAIIEGRARKDQTYLHVQTFYPRFGDEEMTRLLDSKTNS